MIAPACLVLAAPAATEMTFAEALAALRASNPRSEADRARIATAQAEVVAAGVAPNPEFSYDATRLHSGTNTGAADTDQYSLEWPLLVFGQRGARKAAAKSGVTAAEAGVGATFAERALALRKAFGTLWVQQQRVTTLEEASGDLARVSSIVAGRREAGDASPYDALRVDTEERTLTAQLGDARADLADAQGQVARILGRPGFAPHAAASVTADALATVAPETAWDEAKAHAPALVAARSGEDAAAAAERAARRDRYPVPSLTGGVENTRDASSRSALFGISVPLPFLDRNQGGVARARAAAGEASLDRLALEAEWHADLDTALAVDSERRAAVATIESGVAARLPELRSMAETAYKEGRGGILDFLDALRTLTASRLTRLDALEEESHADAELLFLLGRVEETPQ
ncbi:MAG TPA: TolC family protein [Candidatus Polarisedimenticolaceae bacterium]|nr:TolC family protein [Candidatus Polarisedimenticolaceae bacterium]